MQGIVNTEREEGTFFPLSLMTTVLHECTVLCSTGAKVVKMSEQQGSSLLTQTHKWCRLFYTFCADRL